MHPVRDAATVMLVRDRPELHVFVLRRAPTAVFGPGATVFPGGAVDPDDHAPAMHARVVGLDDRDASSQHNLSAGGLAFRVAATRECFEEAGILLARGATHGEPVGEDTRFARWRAQINAGTATFAQMLAAEDLVVDARDLHVFSHWLTPVGAPRRYNTWFFVAAAPDGHEGAHDDNELVSSAWIRPADALVAHAHGDVELIFPTQRSLETLARYPTVEALRRELGAVEHDADGRPAVVTDGPGERVALASDPAGTRGRWTIPLPDRSVAAEHRSAREGVA